MLSLHFKNGQIYRNGVLITCFGKETYVFPSIAIVQLGGASERILTATLFARVSSTLRFRNEMDGYIMTMARAALVSH